jgi:protein Mpv17
MRLCIFLLALLAISLSPVRSEKATRINKGAAVAKAEVKAYPQLARDSNKKVGSLERAYFLYLNQCTDNPFVTKSTTAAIVTSFGDIMAQKFEAYVGETDFVLKPMRLGTFFLSGLLFVGPFIHLWYGQLINLGRWMETKYGASKTKRVIAQLFVDQTIGVAFFFPAYFYVYEYLEAFVNWRPPSLSRAHTKCIKEMGKVILMQYRVYPLCNAINFAFVPEQLRVLYSNTVSAFWNIYLCTIIA